MKTEAEIRARITELQAIIAKGPDNDLQASMWLSLQGFVTGLEWVLSHEPAVGPEEVKQ